MASDSVCDIYKFLNKIELYSQISLKFPAGVVLYGAGELGELAIAYCNKVGIQVHGILDKSCSEITEREFHGIHVMPPSCPNSHQLKEHPILVCIATYSYLEIRESLQIDGWKKIYPFYQLTQVDNPKFPLTNGWLIESLTNDEIYRIGQIYESAEDQQSRSHYRAFIAWHASYIELVEPEYPIRPSERYAIEPLLVAVKDRSQRVIDVGAHHGQLLSKLISKDIHVTEYHAFEPDPQSYRELCDKLKTQEFANIKTFASSICISNQRGIEAGFYSGLGYCSKIAAPGTIEVRPSTIDSLDVNPTIIKYHTEGSELDCLKGSYNTIEKFKPIIICALYHNRSGLCETISYLRGRHPYYRFYLRMHSYQGTGFFVYAIPEHVLHEHVDGLA